MLRKLSWLLLLSLPCLAQTRVTITGTIQTPSGTLATNGYVNFALTPQNQALLYKVAGTTTVIPQNGRCGINGSGLVLNTALSGPCQVWGNDLITPTNSLYQITIAPNNQVANVINNVLISGTTTIDLSNVTLISPQPVIGTIVNASPLVTMSVVPARNLVWSIGTPQLRYVAGYFGTVDATNGNFTSVNIQTCTGPGCSNFSNALAFQGNPVGAGAATVLGQGYFWNGTAFNLQTKPFIDVRDLPGMVCDGSADSSTPLNELLDFTISSSNVSAREISFRNCPLVRVDHEVKVRGQSYVDLEGGQRNSLGSANGAAIFGCNGAAGPVLSWRRTGHSIMRGISVYAKGSSCSSNFTESIRITNVDTGGVTTTDLKFEDIGLTTSVTGAAIPNYIAFRITGGANMEDMRLHDSWIHCQFSSASRGVSIEGLNSDNDEVVHNNISGCFNGVYLGSGGATIARNKFNESGDYTAFGSVSGGSAISLIGCVQPVTIQSNEAAEGTAQFINSNITAGCGRGVTVNGNQVAWTSGTINPAVYPIDVGNAGGRFYFTGNEFNAFIGSTSSPIIGNSAQGASFGSTASVYDFGNRVMRGNLATAVINPLLETLPFQAGQFGLTPDPADTNGGQLWNVRPIFAPAFKQNTTASPFITFRSTGVSTKFDFVMGGNASTFYVDNVNDNLNTGVFSSTLPIAGGFKLVTVSNWPGTPFSVSNVGSAGSTSYSYQIVAMAGSGGNPSTTVTTAFGNATLDTTNFNRMLWTLVKGASAYRVYRMTSGGTPSSTGLIKTVSADVNAGLSNIGGVYSFDDTGLAGDSSSPPGSNTADGRYTIPVISDPSDNPLANTMYIYAKAAAGICSKDSAGTVRCGSSGGVSSVGLAGPTGFIVTGSPVTTSGTLTFGMPFGWTTGDILIGNGANSVSRLAIGAAGTALISNGTTATWTAIPGTGTVTDFTTHNITGFATQAVTNSTTTPDLTFTLINAGAHLFWGNNTAGALAPSYVAINEADVTNLVTDLAAKITASSANTLTNKDFDTEGTGNVLHIPSWADIAAGGCNNATAGPSFDLPTSGAPTPVCLGSATTSGLLGYPDATTSSASAHISMPPYWDITKSVDVTVYYTGDTSSTNNIRWQASTACVADGEDLTSPTFNPASATNSAGPATAGLRKSVAFSTIDITNCAASETMFVKIERVGANAGDTYTGVGELLSVGVMWRNAI